MYKRQLATAVGGVAEVVTPETGILVAAGDVEGLARGIVRLAGDGEARARMGERARRHVSERFAVERLIGDVDSLYGELVGGRAGGRVPPPVAFAPSSRSR